MYCRFNTEIRAVYTGTEKPEFFSHSGFSLEVARQIPLNTVKNRIEKPTSEVWFFETPPVFHWFFANVNACSPLTGIIRFFGHVGRDLLRNHPQLAAHYVRSKVAHAHHLPKKQYMYDIRGVFAHAGAFLAKKTKSYGFFWQCKRYNKKPSFFFFWFLPM